MPCPACGSPIGTTATDCGVCGYDLTQGEPRSAEKCSRCGSQLGEEFQFCQVCGLAIGLRAPRPQTQRLKVLTTEVRKLRKQATGEHAAQSGELPIGTANPAKKVGDAANAAKDKPPRRGPRRAAGARPGARGPGPEKTPKAAWNARQITAEKTPQADPAPAPEEDRFAALGASPLRLVLVNRDGSDGESFFFPDSLLTLGREGSDLVFADDEFLSPRHARLEIRDDGIWVVDLESLNGVFLRITDTVPVFPGDTILLGHQLLRLDNVPDPPAESDLETHGARLFGTPLDPAWACLTRIGYGGVEAESYFLRSAVVAFGREQGDIVFGDDAFISRQHAQLGVTVGRSGMAVSLSDLGSANGTYIRIRGSARISVDGMFRVGDQIFRLRTD